MLEHAQDVAGGDALGVRVLSLGVAVSVSFVLGAAVLEPHLHLADRTVNVLFTSVAVCRVWSALIVLFCDEIWVSAVGRLIEHDTVCIELRNEQFVELIK